MPHAALLRSPLFVVGLGLVACAQVAAPMPPNAPPPVGLHAENTVQDGLPNYAWTAPPSTPAPPDEPSEWMPDGAAGYTASRLFDALDPTRGCGLALSAEFDPRLSAMDALPAAPVTRLELEPTHPRPDCPPH